MSRIWKQLSEMNADSPGRVAHARKTATNYAKMEPDAKQRFNAAGYKHRVNVMDTANPPSLAQLVQQGRDALNDPSVSTESLLSFPSNTRFGQVSCLKVLNYLVQ